MYYIMYIMFTCDISIHLGSFGQQENLGKNKNDNIHKNEDDQMNMDKYRVAANIKENHYISKLFLKWT